MTKIQNTVIKYLSQTFKPVRLTFPIKKGVNYSNQMFLCSRIGNSMYFYNDGVIKTPETYLSTTLNVTNVPMGREEKFNLIDHGSMCTLDTMGKIPARTIYMLKDFFFRNDDSVTIDTNSMVKSCEIEEHWSKRVTEYPEDILHCSLVNAVNLAEKQTFKFKVVQGPAYFENREWYTRDHDYSQTVKQTLSKSVNLYSLGNTDEIKRYKYNHLAAAGGGISMSYSRNLPWYDLRECVMNEIGRWVGSGSSGYLDTRGSDTYDQRKDLSVTELVVLYEFLKAEGADVKILNINGITAKNFE